MGGRKRISVLWLKMMPLKFLCDRKNYYQKTIVGEIAGVSYAYFTMHE